MISRTRVPRWTPPLKEALRLAWRPAVSYLVFVSIGSIILLLTIAWYSHGSSKDTVIFLLSLAAGLFGILLGQAIAILRFRALPVFIVGGMCIAGAAYMMAMTNLPGGEYVAVPLIFFCFAFPCGMLSLQHRWELFASFWPAVGFIGAAITILNEERRIHVWEESKVQAWLPVPLIFLGLFLVLWLFYLAAKQAARVEMWQALSGAAARRIQKKERKNAVSAIPRRNVLPILVLALVLFGVVAVLAPYLWRTGKGDHDGGSDGKPDTEEPRRPPNIDAEGLVEQLKKMAEAAKNTLPKLWPLLLLILLYRPAKRGLLLTHLKAPIVPTPPSERIDNLWEYIRISAEDAGVVPANADSVEQLMKRIRDLNLSSAALDNAAEIYVRTRYGFVVQRGDAVAMRGHAIEAVKVIRKDLGAWVTIKNVFRPLS